MALQKVAQTSDVPPGSVIEVMHAGEPVALCHVDGEWHAMAGVCPHRGGPLGQGAMEGKNVLCPWHAWAFHAETGENDFNPACRVATYPVVIRGSDVLVDFA